MITIKWLRKNRKKSQRSSHSSPETLPLNEIKPGQKARVLRFDDNFPHSRRAYLMAYGVAPGYWIDVLQQSPITVVQIEWTELALENDLSRDIWVTR